MSKEQATAKKNPAPSGPGASADDTDFAAPEGMTLGEVYLYRPGPVKEPGIIDGKPHCGWKPLQGYIAEAADRTNETYGDYKQLVLVLTKPCMGIDNGKLHRVDVGKMVCLTVTGNLKELARFAAHKTETAEVFIQPTGEMIQTKRGKMRQFKQVVTKVIERKLVNLPKLPPVLPEDADDDAENYDRSN